MVQFLLTASFVAGLIPAVLFVTQYARRSAWRTTPAGKAVMGLMTVIATTYSLTVLALIWPEFFLGPAGTVVRIVVRLVIAAVLWNLWWVLRRAQREDANVPGAERPVQLTRWRRRPVGNDSHGGGPHR